MVTCWIYYTRDWSIRLIPSMAENRHKAFDDYSMGTEIENSLYELHTVDRFD